MAEINYQLFGMELQTIAAFNDETTGIIVALFVNACDKMSAKYSNNNEVKRKISNPFK